MTNDYFDSGDYTELTRITLARAEAVNAIFSAIVTGLDKLPSEARIKEGRVTYCGLTSGTTTAATVTAPYGVTLTDGLRLLVKWGLTNTGPLTLNVTPTPGSALGAIPIVDFAGNALVGGECIMGVFGEVIYSSTLASFQILNPNVDVASLVVNNLLLVSSNDTTPGYLNGKLVVGKGLVGTENNNGANENFTIDVQDALWNNFTDVAVATDAASGKAYRVTAASATINLSGLSVNQIADVGRDFATSGHVPVKGGTIDGVAENFLITDNKYVIRFRCTGANTFKTMKIGELPT